MSKQFTKKKYGREILGLSPDGSAPNTVLEMLNVSKPAPKRKRDWENQRPVASYRIPAPLIATAKEAQEKILSRAENNESGRSRSGLSADIIANAILRWSIDRVNENPKILPQSLNPRAKTGMTAYAAEWDDWDGTPPVYPTPRRRNKKKQSARFVIAYRLHATIKSEIKRIAEDRGLPVGEVFLFLIQFGLAGHDSGRFCIKPTGTKVVFTDADVVETKNEDDGFREKRT
jgi:hypothetical protein